MSKIWYRYTDMTDSVGDARTLESTRDTDATIFYLGLMGKERRMKKRNSWETWVDSVEELEHMIAARKEREDSKRKDMLVRKAAPDLLDALEGMLMEFNEKMAGVTHDELAAIHAARRATAKAKGEQQ